MRKHTEIYQAEADRYDHLVMREDYQHHLLPAINEIIPLKGIDVVESGAGTGRLTLLLAPLVHSIRAFDASSHMLRVAADKGEKLCLINLHTRVADHRSLPVDSASADLVLSGWSVCYLQNQAAQQWQQEVTRALEEMERILKPGGTLLLIETLGTGFEEPHPPDNMVQYLAFLEANGFTRHWIRTDYQFENQKEAYELTEFFFGAETAARFESGSSLILPECTGLWWKRFSKGN